MPKVSELRCGTPGIALASAAEAQQALQDLKSSTPMAVLSTRMIEHKGEEILVPVRDAQGRSVQRKRYLIQLGTGDVTYKSLAPKGGNVETPGTHKVIFQLARKYARQSNGTQARKQSRELFPIG